MSKQQARLGETREFKYKALDGTEGTFKAKTKHALGKLDEEEAPGKKKIAKEPPADAS